ncbi:GNAT family N-acetyltransferase [Sphingosinicella rhizophila]|uniref:GNAT family N-acetyltransferase n=1 Tax=Sphingosinicella rhizophila TaxID=3050082 RepID=A0ABU3Q259_9SPHN|nr:GNAT family N-acetyltransferase [Sphingosinicella sp. GR2756]MDT9597473.1 GNAT family N-acetyltransferase [Sphingosinicella sp. GR2756]
MPITVRICRSPEDWQAARLLLGEYWAWLDQPPGFQDFETEKATLEGLYSGPAGCFLLASSDCRPVACGAYRRHDAARCEAKRVFVRPAFQGSGLGRIIVERLIGEAREAGYSNMVADTMPFMTAALALYLDMGFERRGPYSGKPTPGAIFLTRAL